MNWSKLDSLVDALRCLPGVGAKTAQRMAYYLLQRDRPGAERLAVALTEAVNGIRHCERCNNFTEQPVCDLCASPRRNQALLAVVESPADLVVVEQTHSYNGLYFVLMGKLSPLDGVGPKDIHLDRLIKRAADNLVNEVIIATNFTVEGEATAHYIGESLRGRSVRITRIARGLPVGGELEHVDSGTIAQALVERREI